MGIGVLFLLAGFALCVLGLTGTIEFLIETAGFKARLLNGTPGAFFGLLGLLLMWRYKPKVSTTTTRETKTERKWDNNGIRTVTTSHITHEMTSRSEVRSNR